MAFAPAGGFRSFTPRIETAAKMNDSGSSALALPFAAKDSSPVVSSAPMMAGVEHRALSFEVENSSVLHRPVASPVPPVNGRAVAASSQPLAGARRLPLPLSFGGSAAFGSIPASASSSAAATMGPAMSGPSLFARSIIEYSEPTEDDLHPVELRTKQSRLLLGKSATLFTDSTVSSAEVNSHLQQYYKLLGLEPGCKRSAIYEAYQQLCEKQFSRPQSTRLAAQFIAVLSEHFNCNLSAAESAALQTIVHPVLQKNGDTLAVELFASIQMFCLTQGVALFTASHSHLMPLGSSLTSGAVLRIARIAQQLDESLPESYEQAKRTLLASLRADNSAAAKEVRTERVDRLAQRLALVSC